MNQDLAAKGKIKIEKVLKFIRNLTHTQGEWAGKPFSVLDWQREKIIEPFFGTLREDGNRQYRFCYIEIPKKNGKTEMCAALALYGLCADKEAAPEVYVAAADREQAGKTFMAAKIMVENSSALQKNCKIVESRKRIINRRNNGFLQVLSHESRTKHGFNPSFIVFDELHAQPNDDLWRVLTAGTDTARQQQAVFVLTTAGIYDKESIWWRIRTKAQQIEKGIIKQSDFLPVLYLADPEKDDPHDEKVWERTNPSLGKLFALEKMRETYNSVKNDPIEWQDFLRFRLNIPIKSLVRWMPMDKWDKCGESINLESLKGRVCCGGLDLSSKLDLSAFILVFPPADKNGMWDIICRAYCPEDGIIKRSKTDRVHYDIWQKEGFLTATPGNVIDYEFIEKDILEAARIYDMREMGFDSWNATDTSNRIMKRLNPTNYDQGFQMIEMRQGAKTFNEPAKDLLVHVMTEKVRHGGHPVLRWCADNLVMRLDPNGNVAPDKEKATDKIDLMVALIMAWGRAMFKTETKFEYHPGSIARVDQVGLEPDTIEKKEIKKVKIDEIPCKRCGKDVSGLIFCKNCGLKVNI